MVVISIHDNYVRVLSLQLFNGCLQLIIVIDREIVELFQAVMFVIGSGVVGLESCEIDWHTTYREIAWDNHSDSPVMDDSLQSIVRDLKLYYNSNENKVVHFIVMTSIMNSDLYKNLL